MSPIIFIGTFFLWLTSKMSHAHGRRASCDLRLLILWLHLIQRTLAGGVTDVGVGSGALLGPFSWRLDIRSRHSKNASETIKGKKSVAQELTVSRSQNQNGDRINPAPIKSSASAQ